MMEETRLEIQRHCQILTEIRHTYYEDRVYLSKKEIETHLDNMKKSIAALKYLIAEIENVLIREKAESDLKSIEFEVKSMFTGWETIQILLEKYPDVDLEKHAKRGVQIDRHNNPRPFKIDLGE